MLKDNFISGSFCQMTSLVKRIVLGLVVLFISSVQVYAGVITINRSGSGSMSNQGFNNGNLSINNYLAGVVGAQDFRNHFDFLIPESTDSIISATLSLKNNFTLGSSHTGGTNTYTISKLGSFGSYTYSQIGQGTTYGSVDISSVGTVLVTLNAAAISDILAAKGGTFSLGGVITGGGSDFGFSGTGGAGDVQLTLNTAPPVPEPTSMAIFGLGALGMAYRARRKAKAKA